jgi:hypothetical protein
MMEAVRRHSPIAVGAAENHVREGEAWIQVDRFGQFRYRLVEAARHRVHIAGGEMRPGIVGVRLDGPLRHGSGLGEDFARLCPPSCTEAARVQAMRLMARG